MWRPSWKTRSASACRPARYSASMSSPRSRSRKRMGGDELLELDDRRPGGDRAASSRSSRSSITARRSSDNRVMARRREVLVGEVGERHRPATANRLRPAASTARFGSPWRPRPPAPRRRAARTGARRPRPPAARARSRRRAWRRGRPSPAPGAASTRALADRCAPPPADSRPTRRRRSVRRKTTRPTCSASTASSARSFAPGDNDVSSVVIEHLESTEQPDAHGLTVPAH